MYDLCECGRPVTQGRANIVWKMKTGKKHYLNDTSLIGIWQTRIEFSPLRETDIIKNKISQGTHQVQQMQLNPGEAVIQEEILFNRGCFAEDVNRQEVHESLSLKGGMPLVFLFFPICQVITR